VSKQHTQGHKRLFFRFSFAPLLFSKAFNNVLYGYPWSCPPFVEVEELGGPVLGCSRRVHCVPCSLPRLARVVPCPSPFRRDGTTLHFLQGQRAVVSPESDHRRGTGVMSRAPASRAHPPPNPRPPPPRSQKSPTIQPPRRASRARRRRRWRVDRREARRAHRPRQTHAS